MVRTDLTTPNEIDSGSQRYRHPLPIRRSQVTSPAFTRGIIVRRIVVRHGESLARNNLGPRLRCHFLREVRPLQLGDVGGESGVTERGALTVGELVGLDELLEGLVVS